MPKTIKLEINATVNGIELIASGHANEMKFNGVLVNLDTPSSKPPNGSQGKRILIPMATAKAALHTLINMGVNYTDKLDGHNPRKKVGVIKKAWIDGHDIRISGIIWKKDFPEAEVDLKKKSLGMSFEATEIAVEDQDAPIWKITRMCFTGASILYKKDAAYQSTEALAAAKLRKAASQITLIQGGISMAHKNKIHKVAAKKSSKKVSAATTGDLGEVLASLTEVLKGQTKALNTMTASNHSLRSELHEMAAGSINTEVESEELEAAAESEESESEDIQAAFPPKKKKKGDATESDSSDSESDDDSESMSADADDAGDLEEMESDEPDEDDKPGHLNKEAKQKGSKTQVEDKIGPQKNDAILGASLRKLMKSVNDLKSARELDQKKIKKLERKVAEQTTQITAAGQKVERRSISALGRSMLTKGGVDPEAVHASGKKISVEEIDSMFASSGANLDVTQRMALKTEYARAGVMDEGIISRTPVN